MVLEAVGYARQRAGFTYIWVQRRTSTCHLFTCENALQEEEQADENRHWPYAHRVRTLFEMTPGETPLHQTANRKRIAANGSRLICEEEPGHTASSATWRCER